MKIGELEGATLDAAVALVEGTAVLPYSTDWAHGGPIVERQRISICRSRLENDRWYAAVHGKGGDLAAFHQLDPEQGCYDGLTPLVAAMRAHVASEFGTDIDLSVLVRG